MQKIDQFFLQPIAAVLALLADIHHFLRNVAETVDLGVFSHVFMSRDGKVFVPQKQQMESESF